jgi:hypothetical protein
MCFALAFYGRGLSIIPSQHLYMVFMTLLDILCAAVRIHCKGYPTVRWPCDFPCLFRLLKSPEADMKIECPILGRHRADIATKRQVDAMHKGSFATNGV